MYNTFTSISREDHQRSPLIAFHNVGLSGIDGINSKNWSMETLTSVREKLNIQNVSDQLVYLFQYGITFYYNLVYRYKTMFNLNFEFRFFCHLQFNFYFDNFYLIPSFVPPQRSKA